jgi:hypothetical protein
MAQVTWLGEGPDGPQECGEFKLGEPKEVTDEARLAKYAGNKYYKVEGWEPKEGETGPLLHKSAVETPAQGPVPKPGEPVMPEDKQKPSEPPLEVTPHGVKPKLSPVPKGGK